MLVPSVSLYPPKEGQVHRVWGTHHPVPSCLTQDLPSFITPVSGSPSASRGRGEGSVGHIGLVSTCMHQRNTFGNVSPNDYRIMTLNGIVRWRNVDESEDQTFHTRNALHLDIGRKSTEVKVSQKKVKWGSSDEMVRSVGEFRELTLSKGLSQVPFK